jgi:type I restriction enzyme S subunit
MSSDLTVLPLEDCLDALIDYRGKTPVKTESGIPLITAKIIKGGRIETPTEFIAKDNYDAWMRRGIPKTGDVVLTVEAPLGEVAQLGLEKVALAQRVVTLRGKVGVLDSTYLLYLLQTEEMLSKLKARATGTTVLGIKQSELRKVELQLPPIGMQVSAAATLKAIDDRIALLRETNATLESIAQAMFKSWFVDFDPVHAKQQGRATEGMSETTAALFPDSFEESELGLVPRGWKVSRLGDVVERITKGTTPTTLKRPFVAAGINFVKAESMTDDGDFFPEKFAFIDNETHELLRRSQLAAGDVLISIAGTIGRIAVITEDFIPANTNQAVALIRPYQDRFPSGLVSRFLQKSESRQMMVERVVQAVQANLSLGSLSDLKLAIPSPEVTMQLYETGLAQLDASKASNHQRIRTLATLRDTLLPRLISGQLRLPDVKISEVNIEEVA